jgi:hypothetical protein
MVVILTKLAVLAARHQQSVVDGFLDSSDFKDTVTTRLQATLLDPSLPYYVAGLTPRLVVHSLNVSCCAPTR